MAPDARSEPGIAAHTSSQEGEPTWRQGWLFGYERQVNCARMSGGAAERNGDAERPEEDFDEFSAGFGEHEADERGCDVSKADGSFGLELVFVGRQRRMERRPLPEDASIVTSSLAASSSSTSTSFCCRRHQRRRRACARSAAKT
eukprot:1032097-Rhodomonas_salina.1